MYGLDNICKSGIWGCKKKRNIEKIAFKVVQSSSKQCILLIKNLILIYKPDSKKVGTLYKLWIKKECNNLQIS